MVITNRTALQPARVGLEIVGALSSLVGEKYDLQNAWRLVGSQEMLTRVRQGHDPAAVAAGWSADEGRWRRLRAKYLLYR